MDPRSEFNAEGISTAEASPEDGFLEIRLCPRELFSLSLENGPDALLRTAKAFSGASLTLRSYEATNSC